MIDTTKRDFNRYFLSNKYFEKQLRRYSVSMHFIDAKSFKLCALSTCFELLEKSQKKTPRHRDYLLVNIASFVTV